MTLDLDSKPLRPSPASNVCVCVAPGLPIDLMERLKGGRLRPRARTTGEREMRRRRRTGRSARSVQPFGRDVARTTRGGSGEIFVEDHRLKRSGCGVPSLKKHIERSEIERLKMVEDPGNTNKHVLPILLLTYILEVDVVLECCWQSIRLLLALCMQAFPLWRLVNWSVT